VIKFIFLALFIVSCAQAAQWPTEQANQWYSAQPWLVGSNFIPSNAINQLEMWQPETFDPARIDFELGLAQNLGMNTVRVFLHDLLWQQDSAGFQKRIGTFLDIAARHGIKPIFVLFDSCWDPQPQLGQQRAPRIGVHNSGWVQSPGMSALQDATQTPRLKNYVEQIVGAFAQDSRILAWDVWNEPNNMNQGSYNDPDLKMQKVLALLPQVFQWARTANPSQPLTSGIWEGDWSKPSKMSDIQKIQIGSSDIISFHNYGNPNDFEQRVNWLKQWNRPVICTEYMARPMDSTFAGILPIARANKVGAFNWGFVAGKTQTYLPWDSWSKAYPPGYPKVWFHDIFYPNGQPFDQTEADFLIGILSR
jgi:hypothetical protein